jgi:hypothetical protein
MVARIRSTKNPTMKNEKGLDMTLSDTWKTRDEMLGGMTYPEYLQSDHWRRLKYKARQRPNYQKCEFCPSILIELHHTSYKWLLTEHDLSTIIPLCREHHQEVHDFANATDLSVRLATIKVRKKYSKISRAEEDRPIIRGRKRNRKPRPGQPVVRAARQIKVIKRTA